MSGRLPPAWPCVTPTGRTDCHMDYVTTGPKPGTMVCAFCGRDREGTIHDERAARASADRANPPKKAKRPRPLTVPADLRERLADEAAAMGVPVEWVLRAAIHLALDNSDQIDLHDLVLAVEDEARKSRIAKMPRIVKG